MALPKEMSVIAQKNLIGRVDYSPSGKSFITLESKENPSQEVYYYKTNHTIANCDNTGFQVKIVAEDDATLKFAKEVVFTDLKSLSITQPQQVGYIDKMIA